jgi:hypothetical protein
MACSNAAASVKFRKWLVLARDIVGKAVVCLSGEQAFDLDGMLCICIFKYILNSHYALKATMVSVALLVHIT